MNKVITYILFLFSFTIIEAQHFDYVATGINLSPGEYGLSGKGINWFKSWGLGSETTLSYRTNDRPKNQDGLNFSALIYPAFPLNDKGFAVEGGAGVFYQLSFKNANNNIGMELHFGLDYKHQYLPFNFSFGWNPRIVFSAEIDGVESKDRQLVLKYPYIAFRIQVWGEYKREVINGAKSGKLKKSKIF